VLPRFPLLMVVFIGCGLGLLAVAASAQPISLPVTSTFDGDLDGWTEEDCCLSYASSGGHPGGYASFFDGSFATDTHILAPAKFLGDWSALDDAGALSWDHTVVDFGSFVELATLGAVISGPGGQAVFDSRILPWPGEWQTIVAPLLRSQWTMRSGTWSALLANVTEVRIQIEAVVWDQDEWPQEQTGIDNVRLALGELPEPLAYPVLSEFTEDLEGWVLTPSRFGRLTHAEGGNPGGCAQYNDESLLLDANIIAPASFRGDWSALDGIGVLTWDHRRIDGYAASTKELVAYLEGPGGSAIYYSGIHPAISSWVTVSAPLREENWNVYAGSWQNLLANVTSLQLRVDLLNNKKQDDPAKTSEISAIDNVRVDRAGPTAVPLSETDETVTFDLFPNPLGMGGELSFLLQREETVAFELYDLRGRLVHAEGPRLYPAGAHMLPIQAGLAGRQPLPAGIYVARVRCGDRYLTGKLTVVK
jgi:hypothetical protein